MYTSLITNAVKGTLQEDGSTFLDVEFDILLEGVVIDTKKLGFAADIDTDSLLAELKKYIQNYEAEEDSKALNAEQDAETVQLDAVIEDIIGLEVTTE